MTWQGEGVLYLASHGHRYRVPGSVPAGTYQMEATFNRSADTTSTMPVGEVTVVAGQPIAITCRTAFTRCQVD